MIETYEEVKQITLQFIKDNKEIFDELAKL